MDHDTLNDLLGRFVGDLGAVGTAGAMVIGNRLGLYRELARGPATPEGFAERTGYHLRYLTEWLRGQAAGGYVQYDAGTGRYWLTEEQKFALTDPEGPVFAPGATTMVVSPSASTVINATPVGSSLAWSSSSTPASSNPAVASSAA